jgi:hypothetical protein
MLGEGECRVSFPHRFSSGCPVVFVSELLWRQLCTNFIFEVVVHDGICSCNIDVLRVSYIYTVIHLPF